MKRRLALGMPLLLASTRPARADSAPAQPGEAVRWPGVQLLDGRRLEPAHWQGRAAVVVFWSTTCPFCLRHNVHVEKLHRAARAAGLPLTVLGVARDRSAEAVRRHVAVQGYSFDVTMDAPSLRAALASRNMIPLTAAVRRDGRLAQVLPGEMFEDDVMQMMQLGREPWAEPRREERRS